MTNRGCCSTFWFISMMLAAAAHAGTPHVITPKDIAMLRNVSDAQIAPNGQRVIYTLRTPGNPTKLGPTRLWVVAVGDGAKAQPLPGSKDGDSNARWSPDSHSIAFLRVRNGKGADSDTHSQFKQIWLRSSHKSTAHLLIHLPGSVSSFRWSPNGQRIAALVHSDSLSPKPSSGVDEVGEHPSTARIYIIDVPHGTARAVTSPKIFAFDMGWSPSGKRLLVRYGKRPGPEFFWYLSRIAVINLQGKRLDLLPHHATAMHASFSPDGHSIAYGYFDSNGITVSAAVYDLNNGISTELGKQWKGAIRSLRWNKGGHSLSGIGALNLSPLFIRVNASSGKVSPRFAIKGDTYDFSRANNGMIAFIASTRQRPANVWVSDEGKPRVLTHANPQVANWRLGHLETVRWHSRHDATVLQGLLMLPPDAHPGHPLKTLVQIHGGPLDSWPDGWLGSWTNWAQLLASHGYAVFMPNPRGSENRGVAFATANVRDWGGGDFQDILDGVTTLEKRGIIDPHRVAIAGWSYGGYMSAWAAGHPDPFKTAIDGAGPTDLESMALTTDVGYSFMEPYFGDPIDNQALYAEHSPLTYAHDVHMPVLILHGGNDTRVPPSQSLMLYNALRNQGTRVKLVLYPGAPHWFGGAVGPAYSTDVQKRVLDWLNHYLAKPDRPARPPRHK